ncbi:voltage-dependent calcium channel gamma-6 subunit isoform X2 [Phyllobates terribilis]|uniref:voltage-dependent calcium channel gamma-6 subunit isoform X2 n=1 Tax=Phyllobates terribilis TaxID=111132 RepID=UPI003CCA72F9
MMWPNFFMQEEEQRFSGRGRGQRGKGLTDAQEGKIKLAFFVALVGVTLSVLAVGTEFWVEVNTYKQNHSMTCEAAHFGLWKFCYKKLWISDVDEYRPTCGPAELPGDSNCSYFKFFTTGENAYIFQRVTHKGIFVLVAMVIFHQAVGWLMASNQNVQLEYEYSWSVACAAAAGGILIFGGICCIFLVLPSLPKKPWEYCMKKGNSS